MSPSSLKARLVNSLAEYIEGLERSLAARGKVIDSIEAAVRKEETRIREVRVKWDTPSHHVSLHAGREDEAWLEDLSSRAQKEIMRLALRSKVVGPGGDVLDTYEVVFVGFEGEKPGEDDLRSGDWIGSVKLQGFDPLDVGGCAARFLVLSERRVLRSVMA